MVPSREIRETRVRAAAAAPAVIDGTCALLPLLLLAACGAGTTQPIGYNHNVHVGKLQIQCDTCHTGSTSAEVAGLPTVSDCADCHREANSNSPEERKVVDAVAADRAIPWVRLYQLPTHVFFTHRRHTQVAGIACERCHGNMGAQTRPPPVPLVALTMTDCMNCHREKGVRVDCAVCHR